MCTAIERVALDSGTEIIVHSCPQSQSGMSLSQEEGSCSSSHEQIFDVMITGQMVPVLSDTKCASPPTLISIDGKEPDPSFEKNVSTQSSKNEDYNMATDVLAVENSDGKLPHAAKFGRFYKKMNRHRRTLRCLFVMGCGIIVSTIILQIVPVPSFRGTLNENMNGSKSKKDVYKAGDFDNNSVTSTNITQKIDSKNVTRTTQSEEFVASFIYVLMLTMGIMLMLPFAVLAFAYCFRQTDETSHENENMEDNYLQGSLHPLREEDAIEKYPHVSEYGVERQPWGLPIPMDVGILSQQGSSIALDASGIGCSPGSVTSSKRWSTRRRDCMHTSSVSSFVTLGTSTLTSASSLGSTPLNSAERRLTGTRLK